MAKKPANEITVIAEGTDEWGRRHFLLGAGGKPIPHLPPVLASRLINSRKEVEAELVNAGFNLFTASAERAFVENIQNWGKKESTFRVATQIGWNGRTYVLPDEVFDPQRNVYPLLGELDPATVQKYRQSENSLRDWQENIGNLCLNNSRLMFAVALAFTGPILRFASGERSGGFQICGDPETGKTTAAMIAGSVWGCNRQKSDIGFLESWNTTENAAEVTARAHNDGLLILDETKKAGSTPAKRVEVVLNVTMRLAQQQGKKRLTDPAAIKPWRFYFLSTSNFSLEDLAAMGKFEIDDADRGRLVDIPLPNVAHGIYEDLHDFSSGSELTDELKTRCQIYYGVPIRIFLSRLLIRLRCGKVRGLKDGLQKLRQQYFKKLKERSGSAKVLDRASSRFATVYASGAVAIKLGVLDWDKSALGEAVLSCQLDGLEMQAMPKKNSAILATDKKLVDYLRQTRSRAIDLRTHYADPKTHQFGSVPYYQANHKGWQYLYLTAAALRSIIGVGDAAKRYKKSLVDRGRLDTSTGGKGGRRFVVERRIFTGKGKQGMHWVHAMKQRPV